MSVQSQRAGTQDPKNRWGSKGAATPTLFAMIGSLALLTGCFQASSMSNPDVSLRIEDQKNPGYVHIAAQKRTWVPFKNVESRGKPLQDRTDTVNDAFVCMWYSDAKTGQDGEADFLNTLNKSRNITEIYPTGLKGNVKSAARGALTRSVYVPLPMVIVAVEDALVQHIAGLSAVYIQYENKVNESMAQFEKDFLSRVKGTGPLKVAGAVVVESKAAVHEPIVEVDRAVRTVLQPLIDSYLEKRRMAHQLKGGNQEPTQGHSRTRVEVSSEPVDAIFDNWFDAKMGPEAFRATFVELARKVNAAAKATIQSEKFTGYFRDASNMSVLIANLLDPTTLARRDLSLSNGEDKPVIKSIAQLDNRAFAESLAAIIRKVQDSFQIAIEKRAYQAEHTQNGTDSHLLSHYRDLVGTGSDCNSSILTKPASEQSPVETVQALQPLVDVFFERSEGGDLRSKPLPLYKRHQLLAQVLDYRLRLAYVSTTRALDQIYDATAAAAQSGAAQTAEWAKKGAEAARELIEYHRTRNEILKTTKERFNIAYTRATMVSREGAPVSAAEVAQVQEVDDLLSQVSLDLLSVPGISATPTFSPLPETGAVSSQAADDLPPGDVAAESPANAGACPALADGKALLEESASDVGPNVEAPGAHPACGDGQPEASVTDAADVLFHQMY